MVLKMYGRAYPNPQKKGVVPEVYLKKADTKMLFLDTKRLAQVFFLDAVRHNEVDEQMFSAFIKIVFFVNLDLFNDGQFKGQRRDDLAQFQARIAVEKAAFQF